MHTPGGIRSERLLSNGTWQNISTSVRRDGGQGIRTNRGRGNERGRTNQTLNLTIEDFNGDFNPNNPRSPYYGLIGKNTQLRVSTGRSAALEDLFNRSVSNAWTGGTFTWTLSGGTVGDDYDINGTQATHTHPTANVLHNSSADIGEVNHRIRATFNLSAATLTGANASVWLLGRFADVNNYFAALVELQTDGDVTIGLYRRVAGTLVNIAAAVAVDTVASFTATSITAELYIEGSKLYAKAWTSNQTEPDGWMVKDTDTSLATNTSVGLASRRETGNTNANLQMQFDSFLAVPGTIRAHVEVPNLGALRWTPGGHDITMGIQAAGIKRRLSVTGTELIQSAMFREITRSDTSLLVGYWPLEENVKSTSIASGLPNTPPMSIVGTDISFGATCEFAGTTSLVTLGMGIQLRANVLSSTDTGVIKARLILDLPSSEPADLTPIIEVSQVKDASVRKWRLLYLTGGGVRLVGYTHAGTVAEDTGPQTGATVGGTWWVGFELIQSGADVNWEIDISEPASDGSASTGGVSGTFTSSSVGAISGAVIAPTGGLNGCGVGQFGLANSTAALEIQASSLIAHHGETSTRRFARLCTEESIAYEIVGFESDVSSVQMGPQRVATFLQNVEDCEDAELGIMYEARHFFGLVLRTSETLFNQDSLSLSYTLKHLTGEPFPVPDDLLTVNDVTASLPDGTTFRSVEETGAASIQNPPVGIGQYPKPFRYPVRNAVDLPDIARFERHRGTFLGPRYPTIQLDTHRQVFVDDDELSDDIDELELGNRLNVDDLPNWLEPEAIDVLVQGYTERISNENRELVLNTTPASPYTVAVRGSTYYRDSLATVLNEALDTTETGVDVAVTGPLWRTGATSFDIMINGELMTVTNITGASSPQTMTVTRSVNGIVKTHSIGSEVHVYPLPVRGLTSINFNSSVAADAAGDLVVGRDTPPAVWAEGGSTGTFTSSPYIEDTESVGVTFTVPSTGAVLVYIAGELSNDSISGFTLMSFVIRSTSEIGGGDLRLAADDSRAIMVLGTDIGRFSRVFRIDGSIGSFLAGREYNITLAHRRVTAGNSTVSRRLLLVTPDKIQGGLPGSLIEEEPASASDIENASDTSTSVTYTTADMAVCGATFVAPQSGKVQVHVASRIDNSGASSCFVSFEVREGTSIGSGIVFLAASDQRALEHFQANQIMGGATFLVTGLTAGNDYNVQIMHRVSAGTGTLENRSISIKPIA
jgi:hypothetical protein